MHAILSRLTVAAAAALLSTALSALPHNSGQPAVSQSAAAPQTGRVPQFENDDVRVWRSLVLPNAPLTMHRHDHPRVIIALEGGTMNIVDSSGGKEVHDWKSGSAYWLPSNPPGTTHADVNAGDKPIEVMVVELKHEK